MAILFYDHLVTRIEIDSHLDSCDDAPNQKGKVTQIIDDIIFQGIVNMILEKLSDKHHKRFLTHVHERPYDPEILTFLKDNIGPEIETHIKEEADRLVQMIIEDLRSSS